VGLRISASPERTPEALAERQVHNYNSVWEVLLTCLSNSFMEDGMENDDIFRMVEDEFLDTAKDFTQHLHAAEYQRMKKAAKSQNADTISSISRPVTTRMPEETRRKVESVARAKKQASVLNRLLGNRRGGSDTDDDSDGPPGPWVGTALHGLMVRFFLGGYFRPTMRYNTDSAPCRTALARKQHL
jgi:hypothetical protein